MNPLKAFKLFRAYEQAQGIVKEGPMNPKRLTQLSALIAQVLGSFGAAAVMQHALGNAGAALWAAAIVNSLLAIGHALSPSLVPAPIAPTDPNGISTKAGVIVLALLLSGTVLRAQAVQGPLTFQNGTVTIPAPEPIPSHPANIYAAGASYNVGATPAVAGTALYAHQVTDSGTYAFTAIDALPNTLKPLTVSTNIGIGIAQKVATIGRIDVYMPTAAGIEWSGANTGWQWSGGGAAAIRLRGPYYIMPTVRFLKGSVSGGTGYQPIVGVLFGWGK